MRAANGHTTKQVRGAVLRHLPALGLLTIAYATYTRSSIADGLLNDADLLFQVALGTLLFYGNVYWVFPVVGRKYGWRTKTIWLAVLVEWTVLVVAILLASVYLGALEWRISSLAGLTIRVANILAALFPLVLCLFYSVQHYNLHKLEDDRQRVLDDLSETGERMSALRHQWAHAHLPEHFLFNSLSLLRGLTVVRSPHAGKAYNLLLDILHYCLKTRKLKKVSVKKELKMAGKYYRIAQMRYGDAVKLSIVTNGVLELAKTVPMSILTLMENIFAHGDFRDGKAELHVDYRYPYLYITTCNRPSYRSGKAHTGFGLPNLQLRLENSFPDSFLLEYGLVDGRFVVSLLISMDGPCPDTPPPPMFGRSKTNG